PAGKYTVAYSFASDKTFSAATVSATLTINKAPLSVTANDVTMITGEAYPPFTVSYSGFAPGQNASALAGKLTFSLTPSLAPGIFFINPTGLTSSNYDIHFVSGMLTVLTANQAT